MDEPDVSPEIDPVRPEEELLARLEELLETVRASLEGRQVRLDNVIELSGFARNKAIRDAKEGVNESEETRKCLEIICSEVFKKFKACLTIKGVNAHRHAYNAVKIIYKSLQEDVEKRLQKMLTQNPKRTDFQENYEEIASEYNAEKDRATIERTFEELLKFAESLDDEEKRAVRECLDEGSLALFDLLSKSDLSKKEFARIKKVAVGLYTRFQAEIARIRDFASKQATQDEIKVKIKDYLWDERTGLPESFAPDEIEEKTDEVFTHLLISVRHLT